MDILCIIPARGGSKGIPHKNVRLLAGKPLVAHTIEHALEAKRINRVIVSTDDNEISSISKEYGAEVIERPDEISGDKASSESALIHVLKHLNEIEQYEPNLVVFLQATSPLRNPGDIDAAIMKLINCSADSCFSSYKQHFMARWTVDDDGIASPINMKLSNRPTRQEVPIQYLENGNIYVFKPWVLAAGDRLGGKIVTYPMNILDSIQIDSPKDFQPVEKILKMRER